MTITLRFSQGLCLLLFLCVAKAALAIDGSASLISGGKTRSFVFHAPGNGVAAGLPLVFVFHGDGGSGASVKSYTHFDEIADAQHFIVVYPNADTDGGGWHRAIDQPKDVQFTSAMIDYFCATYQIDARRVYATGHSAGGFMTYNLAVNLPNRIAAFAPVAANMYANNGNYSYFSSAAFKPVPICHIHGDPDPTVSYIDPDHAPTPWGEWPLTHFSHYSCNKDTYVAAGNQTLATGVTRMTFCAGNASGGKEIFLIRVTNVGHGWPAVTGFNPAQVIWDFFKNYSISTAASCAQVARHAEGTIHTNGREIVGPCDQPFIPRGVNYSLADDWEFPSNLYGDPTGVNDELSAEIIKAKPNTVRIEWFANRQPTFQPYSVSDLDVVITRFRTAGIVCIIDLHDLTCSNDYATFNQVITPWWKQPAVLALLNKHRGFVMANIANEFGYVQWTADATAAYNTWLNHYKAVITDLRTAGIQVPFVIDAPDCGQNLDVAINAGAELRNHDPLGNIIMSAHAYWYADDAAAMATRVNRTATAPFPIILGEIANIQDATGPCSNNITAYTSLLTSCQNLGVGWLAWTWTDDQCAERRMTPNGKFTDLTSYGNTIVNNPVFGLKDHAPLMDVACIGGPLPVRLKSFTGQPDVEGHVQLHWSIAEAQYFKAFDLERSRNGLDFQRLVVIPASVDDNYQFTDTTATGALLYYRLKMRDTDDTYAYSKMISVQTGAGERRFVYPSPATDYIVLADKYRSFPAKVKVLDAAGRTVMTAALRRADQKVGVAELPSGVYAVVINGQIIGRFVRE